MTKNISKMILLMENKKILDNGLIKHVHTLDGSILPISINLWDLN